VVLRESGKFMHNMRQKQQMRHWQKVDFVLIVRGCSC
jgi:hypothetical protein